MQSAIARLQSRQPYAMLPQDRYGEWKMLRPQLHAVQDLCRRVEWSRPPRLPGLHRSGQPAGRFQPRRPSRNARRIAISTGREVTVLSRRVLNGSAGCSGGCSYEARRRTVMSLRSMDQKDGTVNRAGLAGQRLSRSAGTSSAGYDMPVHRQVRANRAISRCEPTRMRRRCPPTSENRGTTSAARDHGKLRSPATTRNHFLIGIAGLAGKVSRSTCQPVSPGRATRKAYRKTGEVRAWMPAAASNKLVEGRMQHGRIDRIAERRLPVIAKPDRPPASSLVVIGIASRCRAKGWRALDRQVAGERLDRSRQIRLE